MSQKRQQEQDANKPPVEEGCSSDDKRRKTPALKNVVLDVMKLRNLQQFMVPVLEPLIRKVVREEVDMALRKHLASVKQSSGKEMQLSESRSLELKFLDTISLPVFTGSRIEGEGCTTLKVALIDGSDGQVVSSGPISSSKIEIVVLEGDFDGNEGDNWTLEEFKSNLVREREGKRPILTGDAIFNLKKGIGLVGEIAVTDNSSWTRSRKFRLGARLVDNCDGIRVREAKTESFVVRDHRGELYKKHHPPSLLDEVWRLEKIGKEGAFHKRLSKENVSTVKDFLTLLFIDPARLRNILGTGMSAKMWEVTVEHARTCVRDKRIYLYRPRSPEKTGVIFDVVGQVMGLVSDCRYVSADKMSETEKAESHSLVILAFKEWDKVASFDDETSFLSSVGYTPDIIVPSSIYSLGCASSVSLICDVDSNEHLQYFHTDCCSLENPQAGYLYDHSAGAVAIDKAHRRWTMLFSVLRWFSVRRTVLARKIHVSSRETNTYSQ